MLLSIKFCVSHSVYTIVTQVHHRYPDAPGLRPEPEGYLDADHWRHVVVLHPNHDLVVHRQSGCLSDRRANDNAH